MVLKEYLQELHKITLLTPEEEWSLWKAYKDEDNMESRSRLIEQYQPLVFKEAMRWHIPENMVLDAIQEGTVGLIEAVERFDYTRHIAFSLFAVHRIRGRMIDYLNREGRCPAVSLDEPDENGMTLQETLPDDGIDVAEQTGRHLLFEHVSKVLARLPQKEQLVVEGVYLQDKQQKHIAHDLAMSLPYVYRLQKRGIRRVRGMLSQFIHESKKK